MLFDSILFIAALLSKLNCISGNREAQGGERGWGNGWMAEEESEHTLVKLMSLYGHGSWHPQTMTIVTPNAKHRSPKQI